jgi:hypothetical protein
VDPRIVEVPVAIEEVLVKLLWVDAGLLLRIVAALLP